MKIRLNEYDNPAEMGLAQDPGSDLANVYQTILDEETGEVIPAVVGSENLYEEIQAATVGTSIIEIMKLYERTGDDSVLKRVAGTYADLTDYPGSLIEMQDSLNHANEAFGKLPMQIREYYGQDPYRFLHALDDNSFFETWMKKSKNDLAAEASAPVKTAPDGDPLEAATKTFLKHLISATKGGIKDGN